MSAQINIDIYHVNITRSRRRSKDKLFFAIKNGKFAKVTFSETYLKSCRAQLRFSSWQTARKACDASALETQARFLTKNWKIALGTFSDT